MPVIELRNVCKDYVVKEKGKGRHFDNIKARPKDIDKGKIEIVEAVRDLSIEIEDGEFIVLVGPSGCGKSTLLRVIAGLEDITKGELFINGKPANDISPKSRNVAMVFQNYALYPHMTVFKNISFALVTQWISKREIKDRVMEAAKILDIEYLLNRKPKMLSGGQRQRVALGRAMVRKPVAFLLDEPLSNLDLKQRSELRQEIIRLHQHLKAVFVYVTHDQTEAMAIGDRIAVMENGCIHQIDTPSNLYNHPATTFVAEFIGSSRMNLLPAVVRKGQSADGNAVYHAVFAGHPVAIPDSRVRGSLAEYIDKDIILGIRPDNMFLRSMVADDSYAGVLSGTASSIDLLGPKKNVAVTCGDTDFVACITISANVKTGEAVELAVYGDGVCIFDKDTGRAI